MGRMKGRESGTPDGAYWETFFDRGRPDRLGGRGACGEVVETGGGYRTFTVPAAELADGRVFTPDIELVLVAETARMAAVAGQTNVVTDCVTGGCRRPGGSARYRRQRRPIPLHEPEGAVPRAGAMTPLARPLSPPSSALPPPVTAWLYQGTGVA